MKEIKQHNNFCRLAPPNNCIHPWQSMMCVLIQKVTRMYWCRDQDYENKILDEQHLVYILYKKTHKEQ